MRIARIVLPEMKHHRLRDLTELFQIINPHEHRAEGDCVATLELLRSLKREATSKEIDISQYRRKHYSGVRAKDLSAQTDTFDNSHPLFGKMCVFTGALSRYASHSGDNSCWGEEIIPLTYNAAQEWAEKHLDGDGYCAIFGEPDTNSEDVTLGIRVSAAAAAKLKREASMQGITQAALLERLIMGS